LEAGPAVLGMYFDVDSHVGMSPRILNTGWQCSKEIMAGGGLSRLRLGEPDHGLELQARLTAREVCERLRAALFHRFANGHNRPKAWSSFRFSGGGCQSVWA